MWYTIKLPDFPPETRQRLDRVAKRSGYPIESVWLVLRAINIACHISSPGQSDHHAVAGVHVTATDVCRALGFLAYELFGDNAMSGLYRWRLQRSEDVGIVVFSLIEEGFTRASESDSIHDFRHVPLHYRPKANENT
ncbi:MAG: hypothetical protein GC164_08405 [Phycisphaera sp.]|nr:hypothetical protein [Phycisphaera sp.]